MFYSLFFFFLAFYLPNYCSSPNTKKHSIAGLFSLPLFGAELFQPQRAKQVGPFPKYGLFCVICRTPYSLSRSHLRA